MFRIDERRSFRRIQRTFAVFWPPERPAWWGDAIVLVGVVVLLYIGALWRSVSLRSSRGGVSHLSPAVLYYAALSLARMTAAYGLAVIFTLVYGYKAAFDQRWRRVLLPLLEVLQRVPILSFLPIVLLGLTAVLPQASGAELAAIVLIFTSQVWNMTADRIGSIGLPMRHRFKEPLYISRGCHRPLPRSRIVRARRLPQEVDRDSSTEITLCTGFTQISRRRKNRCLFVQPFSRPDPRQPSSAIGLAGTVSGTIPGTESFPQVKASRILRVPVAVRWPRG